MTKDKSRIQSCIDHINTAVDVDPWAKELVAEMGKEILEQLNNSNDCISRQAAIDVLGVFTQADALGHTPKQIVEALPSAEPEIIHCKDCKWWRQQTNYQGVPLSFGFCESDDMWRSLYGETCEVSHIDTDDDFYCGYAERRTDGSD